MTTKKIRSLFIFMLFLLGLSLFAFSACSEKTLTEIKVSAEPEKMTYLEDEELDLTGLVVTALYSNGKSAEITDYTTKPENGATLKTSNKSVLITYTEEGVTKNVSFGITVTNAVVDAEKVSDPAKLNYMIGQTFDPSGMQLKLTYENGKEETKDITSLTGVSYSNSSRLTREDKQITVSYLGKSWTYDLTLDADLILEAENGTPSENNSGYTYNNAVQTDGVMGEWDDKYLASNGEYIGGIAAGDCFYFAFGADKAGSGDVTFRVASQSVKEHDENWTPILMDDCRLNQICDIYVNGVKCEIDDSIILPGGGTEGGEPNFYLWFNWVTVTLGNVRFTEGRNVIQVQFKSAANFDYIIVSPTEDCALDVYGDTDVNIEYTATSVALEQDGDVVFFTIEGAVSGCNGYIGDLLDFNIGISAAPVVSMEENAFTLTVNLTDVELGKYFPSLDGAKITSEKVNVTDTEIQVGRNFYSLKIEEDKTICIEIDSDYKVNVNSATIDAPVVTFEKRDDRACIVISGGVYDVTVAGYTADEAKELIAEKIQKLFYFDFQENNSWIYPLGVNFHKVNILENNTFEIVADITDARGDDDFMIHFIHAYDDGSFPAPGGDLLDFKPDIDNFETTLTIDGVVYKAVYDKENVWGLIYVHITEA